MIVRHLLPEVLAALAESAAMRLLGARQVGKTTLALAGQLAAMMKGT